MRDLSLRDLWEAYEIYGSLRDLWEVLRDLWEFARFMGVTRFMGRTTGDIQSWNGISLFAFSPVFIVISLSRSGAGHLSSSITQYQLVSSNHHQKQSYNPSSVTFFPYHFHDFA